MPRRVGTLAMASALVLLLGFFGAIMPVPYVALRPGPTSDTLGQPKGKPPLIRIDGRRAYPTDGHLNFTTVAYQGGPGRRIDLFTALRGWLDGATAIVPEETIFPRNESVQQVEQENTEQMVSSQEAAIAAALAGLDVEVTTIVGIESAQQGMPAQGRLKAGDVIQAVDGQRIADAAAVGDAVAGHKPGEAVSFTIKRDGGERRVDVPTVASSQGKAVVGVMLRQRFEFPFTVQISVGDVGGPSAGLMFALGIHDKLTPGSMTGGRFIAGTGTITPDGEVGPIGGIQQKVVAARRAGATIFLTPAQNCSDAARTAPDGLRLVKVDTLQGAVRALDALRTGQGSVPAC